MGCSCSSLNEPPEELGEAPQLALLGNSPSPSAVQLVMRSPVRAWHQITGNYEVYSKDSSGNETLMYKIDKTRHSAHGTRMVYDAKGRCIMEIRAQLVTTFQHTIRGYTVIKDTSGKKEKTKKDKELFVAKMHHHVKNNSVEMHFENTASKAKGKLTYVNKIFTADDPIRFVAKGKGAQPVNVGSISGSFGNMNWGETWNLRCAKGMDPFLIVCMGVAIEEMAREIEKARQQRLQNQMNRSNY